MKHEFEQGDLVEFKHYNKQEDWLTGIYVSHFNDKHIVSYMEFLYSIIDETLIRLMKEPFRAVTGGSYFYFDDTLEVIECIENDSALDQMRYDIGNYFQSEKECYFFAFGVKIELNKRKENR